MRYVDWYDGTPEKAGIYLVTQVRRGKLPRVETRNYSTVNGWNTYNDETILAWTFLPEPWDGKAYSRNPYFDPQTAQEKFEAAVKEQLRRQAELIKRGKQDEQHGKDL